MGKRKCLLFAAVVMSVLLVLPVISGCAEKAAPPPAEKVVAYLSLADYTGPIAGLNVPADMGCEDYFKNLNEKGGVDGVKVNFIGVDTRYDLARGVSAYKRYRIEPNLLVVNGISTGLGKAVAPLTEADKVVQLTPGDGEFQAHIGWVFPWGVCYQNAFGASLDWMAEDWKAKGNPGMPTVGYLLWDNPYGREPLHGGKEYAEQVGINLLEPEFFPTGSLDHSVWLTRIAENGADYCVIGGVDPTPTNILRDAHKLGLTETIQFIDSTFWGPAEAVGLKLHPEAAEGALVCVFYLRGDEANVHPLSALAPKYRGKSASDIGATYVTGMAWALVYEAGLKKALDDVGYHNLNGEAMLHGYESLTGVDVTQGIYGGPCTYSPTCRQGSEFVKYYQVQSGKLVDISGWRKAPDCVALYDWSQ